MKIIKPEDLPEILTEEIIDNLVQMALEFPKKTFDWANVSNVLKERGQLRIILDIVEEIRYKKYKEKYDALSDEEKGIDAAKWEKIMRDKDPFKFYGNMGQPETLEEFKNRYGTYPHGYDDHGKKIIKGQDQDNELDILNV